MDTRGQGGKGAPTYLTVWPVAPSLHGEEGQLLRRPPEVNSLDADTFAPGVIVPRLSPLSAGHLRDRFEIGDRPPIRQAEVLRRVNDGSLADPSRPGPSLPVDTKTISTSIAWSLLAFLFLLVPSSSSCYITTRS